MVPLKQPVKVIEAYDDVAKDDGSGGAKQVVVEGGALVTVPSHVRRGDVIWVNIGDGTYTGKV